MGDRGPQRGAARTGYHAIRCPREGGGEGGGREERADQRSTHHLHSQQRPEGGAEGDRHPDYLLRPQRRGGEARDLGRRGRGGGHRAGS